MDSVEVLYERYSRSVFRRARTLLGDHDAAKDAMQEVFLRAMRANAGGAEPPNVLAWLYRTTTNLCLNRLRDAKRRGELLADWSADAPDAPDVEARVALRRILQHVPEALQDIAVYYYVDELSHEEIAAIVGVSKRTIGNRLSRFHELVSELRTQEAAP